MKKGGGGKKNSEVTKEDEANGDVKKEASAKGDRSGTSNPDGKLLCLSGRGNIRY